MLVLALASVSIVVTLMGKLAGTKSTEQKRTQLTGSTGSEAYPAFSPDSKRIAYCMREGAKASAWHVFVRETPSGTPKQLTQGEDNDVAPVWSPDGGALAFERIGEDKVEYIVIPADGGAERKVAEFSPAPEAANPLPGVSWLPDGRSLVVVATADKQPSALAVVALEGGKPDRITNPPEGSEGDSNPVVSPAGDSIAFLRVTGSEGGDIFLCDLKGANPRRVTFDDHGVRGVAWTRDGQDLIYSANRAHGWHLWRIPAGGGSPRDIATAGQQAYFPAIGRNRLAWTDSPMVSAIWRAPLRAKDGADEERTLIRSTGRESAPEYSPDGSRIADVSSQTDSEEIFLQGADGGNRMQLTHLNRARMGRPRWSPDGKQLIFTVFGDQGWDVYRIGAVAGAQPARVMTTASDPSFSHDGKSIYYQSRGQIWKADATGANPRLLVRRMGAGQPVETLDGKYVIYRFRGSIYRVPAEGGEEEEFIEPEHDMFWTSIQPARNGAYYLEWERSRRAMAVSYYDYASRKSSRVFAAQGFDMNGGVFSVSPDEKFILYPKTDRSQTNLMLLENFK